MKQLTQLLKNGKMKIIEAPFPVLNSGQILVRNHHSIISAGTEGKTVSDARKGYIAKAKSRKKEVNQVVQMIKQSGIKSTYKFVMNKLDAPSALGYSCAGEIIGVSEGVKNFKVGDFVACGGKGAYHADVIAVSENLAVKVPKKIDLKHASLATIASIAIQGIRQSNIKLGENCVVIGMGLIGQLTYKLIESAGGFPVGVDISTEQVNFVKNIGLKNVFERNSNDLKSFINSKSDGNGFDSVIITAATNSHDPVNFAGEISRKKGKVVVVGSVPTGFDRENFYKKELELLMSSSYGPGRYDVNYEEKGQDYPIGYVRWTENRNIKSFIDLLESGQLNISNLISHEFSLMNSIKAYNMILSKNENFSAIVINYDINKKLDSKIILNDKTKANDAINLGVIGAGSFAQSFLLPNFKNKCDFIGLVTGSGNSSVFVGKKYNFSYLSDDSTELFNDKNINTILIATRHNLHSTLVMQSIENNKHVFTEKPLAINIKELEKIKKLLRENSYNKNIMIGFNRRFSPAIEKLMKVIPSNSPKSILMRINNKHIKPDHWTNDLEIGGGRVISDACHFIDLSIYIARSEVVSISAECMSDPNNLRNSVLISLKFANGSISSINYFSNGNENLSKEYIEVYSDSSICIIEDFKSLKIIEKRLNKINYKFQDKGHINCVNKFLESVKEGTESPISFEEIYQSSLVTLLVNKSISENRKIEL